MRILLLTHRLPWPPDKGDKIRSFNILRHLAAAHELHVACPLDSAEDAQRQSSPPAGVRSVTTAPIPPRAGVATLCRALAGRRSVSVAHFYSAALQQRIDALVDAERFDAYLCFSSPMAEYLFRSRHWGAAMQGARRLMDFIDVDSHKWRQYADEGLPPWSWVYRYEAWRLAEYERRVLASFDAALVVSAQERDYFPGGATGQLIAVSNGVDLDYFAAAAPVPGAEVVFTGVMDYRPNVDAVCWFARDIWPRIRAAVPEARFWIVGSQPTAEVQRLAAVPGVQVTGRVPDVREYVRRAAVCVAPLRIARGLQNKVLEAMAMSRAVVATGEAHEGLQAEPGRDLLVAPTDARFADVVIGLLGDPVRRAQLGDAARRCVESNYQWRQNLSSLDALLAAASPARPAERRS
ncbi:MAG: TIGR03087 family PEP-CTERM/XrtA system glycosyltransferase [Proteobacteria bacterium]|nr:TIGR03087 family PEP-CTERM/XrtA system glycosyltransferase [Pseudomonadota bacterium]